MVVALSYCVFLLRLECFTGARLQGCPGCHQCHPIQQDSIFLAKLYQSLPCFIPYSKAKFACYSRCFLTSYFCIPVPYNEKTCIVRKDPRVPHTARRGA